MLSFIYVVSYTKTLQYTRRIIWKCTEPIETKIQNTETTSSHLALPEKNMITANLIYLYIPGFS